MPKAASTFLSNSISSLANKYKENSLEHGNDHLGLLRKMPKDWIAITSIRHPVERLLSALFYADIVYKSPVSSRRKKAAINIGIWSYPNNFDEKSLEEKIKFLLKNKIAKSSVKELHSCQPGFYHDNFNFFKSVDFMFIVEKMDICLKAFEAKWNFGIKNKTVGATEDNEVSFYGKGRSDKRTSLKNKYWEELCALYSKDLEVYDYFLTAANNKNDIIKKIQ
jgi:hypothetical protein